MKSVIYILFPEYASGLTSIGIVGMLSIGPLYWFYIRSILSKVSWDYRHFIPSLLVFLAIPWLKGETLHWIYIGSLFHMLVYYFMGGRLIYHAKFLVTKRENGKPFWVLKLMVAMTLLWIGFVLQAVVTNKLYYIGITFSEVVVFFAIALIGMKNYSKITRPVNYQENGNPQLKSLAKNAIETLKKDKLFTKSDLTLALLAKELGATNHHLSKALNNIENKSFPELLSGFRIEHSSQLLKDIAYKNLSIEAIAFESGFNSLSVFYDNFKKYNHITPAEYRRKYQVV
ncbi:helix-turn-helix domain-containing protein [Flagellimonas myxillae]|uniref:helix-turn-helix domain-containing protein n=1 Tax=Flagellimonas myxillae TaxID=2942214 RepID=UPI00201F4BDF|nr:helix-turn-helix domain-containing protein [Muricauda myxillae]MCL6266152.1 helix-turn-helix domain-containing protein [Muricauda myxillae]